MAAVETKFKLSETGSWNVVIEGRVWGKVWKRESDGKWVAILGDGTDHGWLTLGRYFDTRKDAALEVRVESAPNRERLRLR